MEGAVFFGLCVGGFAVYCGLADIARALRDLRSMNLMFTKPVNLKLEDRGPSS